MSTATVHHEYRILAKELNKVLEAKLPPLPFSDGTFIPSSANLEKGVAELYLSTIKATGDAEWVSDATMDIPMVEIDTGEDSYKTYLMASGFNMTLQQRWAEQYSGKLGMHETKLMQAARRVIYEKMNRFAAFGSTKFGVGGFFNDPNVTVINSSFNPFGSLVTAKEIREWLLDINKEIAITSNHAYSNGKKLGDTNATGELTLAKTEIVTPPELEYRMDEVLMPQSEISLLERMTRPGSRISRIRSAAQCSAQNLQAFGNIGNGTKHRMVFYIPDSEYLERVYSLPELAPPDYITVRGLSKSFPMFSLTSKTMVHEPGSMRYVDFPIEV